MNILTWNMCWGCMTVDESYIGDESALAQATHCYHKKDHPDSCRARAGIILSNAIRDYDIIALQEATGSEEILRLIGAHTLHIESRAARLAIPGGHSFAEARVCWRSDKYTLADYYEADITNMVLEGIGAIPRRPTDGNLVRPKLNNVRPIQICVFAINDGTAPPFLFINAHNTKYDIQTNAPDKKFTQNLNHIFLERAISLGIDELLLKKGIPFKFENIIVAGDFNSRTIWKGIYPYKYIPNGLVDPKIKDIMVSSFSKSPSTSCCSGQTVERGERQSDTQENDYILISDNFSFTTNNELYRMDGIPIHTYSPSDHLPIMSTILLGVKRNMEGEQWFNLPQHIEIKKSVMKYQLPVWFRLMNTYMRFASTKSRGELNTMLREIVIKAVENENYINYVCVLFEDYNFFKVLDDYTLIINQHVRNIFAAFDLTPLRTEENELWFRGEKPEGMAAAAPAAASVETKAEKAARIAAEEFARKAATAVKMQKSLKRKEETQMQIAAAKQRAEAAAALGKINHKNVSSPPAADASVDKDPEPAVAVGGAGKPSPAVGGAGASNKNVSSPPAAAAAAAVALVGEKPEAVGGAGAGASHKNVSSPPEAAAAAAVAPEKTQQVIYKLSPAEYATLTASPTCRVGEHTSFLSVAPQLNFIDGFTGENCCKYFLYMTKGLPYIEINNIVGIGFRNNPEENLLPPGIFEPLSHVELGSKLGKISAFFPKAAISYSQMQQIFTNAPENHYTFKFTRYLDDRPNMHFCILKYKAFPERRTLAPLPLLAFESSGAANGLPGGVAASKLSSLGGRRQTQRKQKRRQTRKKQQKRHLTLRNKRSRKR